MGRVALVTGAGSGIGAATALAFAAQGGSVAVVDRDGAAAAAVVGTIMAAGGNAIALTANLSERENVAEVVAHTQRAFGRIDLLHNNAYGLPPGIAERRIAPISALDEAVWDASIAVGLTAVVLAIKAAIPIMRAQGGGAIVNTASVAGLAGDRGNVSYNSVKAAVINLTRVAAIEGAPDGIRVNAVCPGFIDTPLSAKALAARGHDPQAANPLIDAVPLGRAGTPREVANVVLFLASDEAAYVTGLIAAVDGGLSATLGLPAFPRGR